MRPRVVWVLAALVFAAAPLGPASAAVPATAFGGVRDSADLDGPAVVTGSVSRQSGKPSSSEVVLLASPSEDTLASMNVGDSVKLVPVGRSTTDARGRFAIRMDPAVPLAGYVSAHGNINFEVLARGADGFTAWSFSRKVTDPEAVRALAVGRESAVAAFSDTAPDATIVINGGDPVEGVPAPAGKTTCATSLNSVIGTYWDTIAELYTRGKTTVDFTYLFGASSTLGVGYSVSGKYGSYTASGTNTASTTAEVNFETSPINTKRVHQSKFELGKYVTTCWYEQGFSETWYNAKTKRWIGSHQYYTAASYPTATKCSTYVTGDDVTITGHSAITWSNGFKVNLGIGIDLSTRTGFTTQAQQKWHINSATSLCGTNDYPETGARTVVGG